MKIRWFAVLLFCDRGAGVSIGAAASALVRKNLEVEYEGISINPRGTACSILIRAMSTSS